MRGGAIAYTAALAASILVLIAFGVADRRVDMTGHDDFANVWAGPRVLLTGRDPYDPRTWSDSARDVGTSPQPPMVYVYPPWVALALIPVAALPLSAATLVWIAGGTVAAAIAMRRLCAAALPEIPALHAAVAVTLALSGPAISSLLTGQWSFILVAALAAMALALRSRRPVAAGLASVVMLAKPQLFLLAGPALAVHALWPGPDRAVRIRSLYAAAGAGAALIAASWLLIPSWWPAWPNEIRGDKLVPDHVTLPGLLFRVVGEPGLVVGALMVLGAIAVAALFHPRSSAWVPVWLTLSVLAAPYANPYDLLILVVPLVAGAGALDGSPRRAAVVLYSGAAILLLGATLLHDLGQLTYAPLIPTAMFALLVVALWPARAPAAVRDVGRIEA